MKAYERVKYLRKNVLNISQKIFAEKINISRSNLGNIETDKVKLTSRVINDICEVYSVNENWILNGEEPIFRDGNDPLVNQLVELFQTLNDDNKKYLQGYAARLLEEQNSPNKQEDTELAKELAETDELNKKAKEQIIDKYKSINPKKIFISSI